MQIDNRHMKRCSEQWNIYTLNESKAYTETIIRLLMKKVVCNFMDKNIKFGGS